MHKDKNNNLHASKASMRDANITIDADHVLKTVFMQDDATRVVTLDQITAEHISALAAYVYQRDKKRKAATEAVEEKRSF